MQRVVTDLPPGSTNWLQPDVRVLHRNAQVINASAITFAKHLLKISYSYPSSAFLALLLEALEFMTTMLSTLRSVKLYHERTSLL